MLEDLILIKSFAILSISNATQEQEDAAELSCWQRKTSD